MQYEFEVSLVQNQNQLSVLSYTNIPKESFYIRDVFDNAP